MGLWNRLIYVYLGSWILFFLLCVESRYDGVEDLASDFKIVTGDGSDRVRVNDVSVYDSQEDDYLLGYRFKDNSKCLEVFHDDFSLWKHSGSFGLYPYKLLMNFYSKMMLVDYVNKWSYFYKPKGNGSLENDNDNPSYKNLTVVTKSSSGLESNDSSQYYKISMGNVVGYRFKAGVKCLEVRYRDQVLWKYSTGECGGEYPSCLYVNLRSRMVMVDLGDEWSYFEKSFSKKDQLNYDQFYDLIQETSDETRTDLKIITYKNSRFFENDNADYFLKQYRYVYEYRFKAGVKCLEVRYRDQVLWKYNHDECQGRYPRSLYVNLYAKLLMLDLDNDWTYFYKYRSEKLAKSRSDFERVQDLGYDGFPDRFEDKGLDQPPIPLGGQKPAYTVPKFSDYKFDDTKLIILDVETKRTTDMFHYYFDEKNRVGVYIAKDGYLFRKVKQGFLWYTMNSVNVWSTPYYYEYSNRVIVNHIGSPQIYATIYCINGDVVHCRTKFNYNMFTRAPRYTMRYAVEKSLHPRNVTVVTTDDYGSRVNDTTKYSVNINCLLRDSMPAHPNFSSYEYIFEKDARCTLFRFNDLDVWSYEVEENIFPQAIYVHDDLKTVFVEFNKHCYNIYKCSDKSCDLMFSNKLKVIDLELNKTQSTSEYSYSENNGLDIYIPKDGFLFKSARYKGKIIWESKDGNEFSKRVIVEGVTLLTGPRRIIIDFVNGDKRTFHLD